MNYIRHLNAFFSFVRSDDRLACSHVSLYLALFQYWNYNRFQNPFPVYRDNLMNLSKIGSKNTYHKCIRELHEAKYIYYQPTASKFLPVRISVIRLDIPEEQPTRYKQLDLFGNGTAGPVCPKNDTDAVPDLGLTSTDFDTGTVSKMGHNIKPNFKKDKTVSDTHKKIFNRNEKLGHQINSLAGVPNSGHTLAEVQLFFEQNNYPSAEAQKFYLYNQGRGWMLRDKVPIKDWQALAHKWMLGVGKENDKKTKNSETSPTADDLFMQFSKGEKIFNLIKPEHFHQLKLTLTDSIMQDALKERINQLTGTNQHSINQLWDAYLKGNKENDMVKNDEPNLINLAKRIAVFQHFQKQRS